MKLTKSIKLISSYSPDTNSGSFVFDYGDDDDSMGGIMEKQYVGKVNVWTPNAGASNAGASNAEKLNVVTLNVVTLKTEVLNVVTLNTKF